MCRTYYLNPFATCTMWQCARCTWTLLRLAQCAGHTTWTLSWPAQCAGHTQTPFATCPTYFANLNKREDLLFTTQHDGPHKHVILLLSPNTIWGSWKHTQISWNWATTVIYLQTLAWLHESDGTKWVRISFDAVSHRLSEIFFFFFGELYILYLQHHIILIEKKKRHILMNFEWVMTRIVVVRLYYSTKRVR